MRKGRNTMLVAFVVLWGLLLFGSNAVLAAGPKGVLKGTIHWGISHDWVNPSIAVSGQSAQFVLYLFHDSLLKPMPDGTYTPCLAESWTISPDYKVYEFKLRKGVKFHNGDPMTAEDVVFTFEKYKGDASSFIKNKLDRLEAVNPYLFRVSFKEPFPNFLEYFLPGIGTIGWVVPKKYIQKVGDAEFKKHPIGCGPYKFVEFTSGVRIVGEAFEDYWRKVPRVKRLEFLFVPEISTRYAMLKRGEVDFATLMIDVYYERIKKDSDLKAFTPLSPTKWIVYISSQWDSRSPWSDPRVRKAASLALDRKAIAEIHHPNAPLLGSLGFPGDPELLNLSPDPYDPGEAKKLLHKAGYPEGFQGGRFYPFNSAYFPFGEMVANYWKAVGIHMEVIRLERPRWWADRRGKKMKGALWIDPLPAPTIGGDLGYLFSPRGSYGNYPEIEDLWQKYTKAVDSASRKELIGRIQKIIHEKTVFIPITGATSPAAFNARVKGNPYKIQKPYPIWFVCPFEDIEVVD